MTYTQNRSKNLLWQGIRIFVLFLFYLDNSLSLLQFPISAMPLPKIKQFFFLFPSILAMPLPQTICNKFFFSLISAMPLPQIHSHNFFPSILAMPLPQTNWNKFVSLLFRHGHNSIPLFFVIKERDKPNYFSQKNTERIRICVLFYISLLYFGNAIATNQMR